MALLSSASLSVHAPSHQVPVFGVSARILLFSSLGADWTMVRVRVVTSPLAALRSPTHVPRYFVGTMPGPGSVGTAPGAGLSSAGSGLSAAGAAGDVPPAAGAVGPGFDAAAEASACRSLSCSRSVSRYPPPSSSTTASTAASAPYPAGRAAVGAARSPLS